MSQTPLAPPTTDRGPGRPLLVPLAPSRAVGGASGADKDHPARVLATFRQRGRPEDVVIYLPISHRPRSGDEHGIAIPDDARKKALLDSGRQWILASECNIDTWPFDLGQIPNRQGVFHYGHLPPKMFKIIRDACVERYRNKSARLVKR